MELRTKKDMLSAIDCITGFNSLIIECRSRYLKSQGLEQRSNFSGSDNASNIIALLLSQLVITEKNEFTFPINELNEFLNLQSKHTSTRMTRYFKEYGIGDFVSTGKNRYKIFKLVDSEGNELDTEIKREAHYTFYFSKIFIEILREKNIGIDFLDYDKLIKEADNSAKLLEQIANTKTTSVHIQQYIAEHLTKDTYIEIEKDFLNKTGTYDKKVNVTVTDEQGSAKQTCIEESSNEFTPKEIREKIHEIFNSREFISNDPEEIYEALINCVITKEDLTMEQKKAVAKVHPGCLSRNYNRYK